MPGDPLSIVGVGLGVASLAVQLLEGAKTGYSYFEIAADMDGQCESFRLRLRIEYTRLLDWADVAGLADEAEHQSFDGNMHMNRAVVMALLAEISTLLTAMRHSSLENTEAALNETQEFKEPVAEMNLQRFEPTFEASSLPKIRADHRKGLNHVFKISKGVRTIVADPGRRIKWAVRDHERFSEKLRRLRELTNYLHETMGEHKMDLLLKRASETQLAMVQLSTTVGEVKSLLKAMTDTTYSSANEIASLYSETNTIVADELSRQDRLLRQLTSFRIRSFEVEKRAGEKALQNLRVDIAEVEMIPSKGITVESRAVAKFRKQKVWIEWKKGSVGLVEEEGRPTIGIRHERNIQYLAGLLNEQLLPDEFRVPRCLGYFMDRKRNSVGFVFQYPKVVAPSSHPVALRRSLLEDTSPPLSSKLLIATHLANSLLYLHSVNWLHKSLNSTSVLFFGSAEGIEWSHPYISSFEHARPDEGRTISGPAEIPEFSQLYWHPDYMSERKNVFRKTYDIYSLGILLIEIALWRPASQIFNVDDPETIDQETLENVRAGILGEKPWLEDVRSVMGNRYHDATKTCIEALQSFHIDPKENEADAEVGARIQQAFLHSIAGVLNGVVV